MKKNEKLATIGKYEIKKGGTEMRTFFKSIPIPMCGLVLAILSLGNLYSSYHLVWVNNLLGIIGISLMCLILAKIIFVFEHTRHDLKNPIIASTAPTFSMGFMVLCTYLMRWFEGDQFVRYLWLFAIVVQFLLIIYFTYYFLIASDVTMEHVYPSWFVVYCGIGIVPVTCANFYHEVGRVLFWMALLFYFILLPVIIYRVFIHRKFEAHTTPLVTILAAPGSLCLAGYLSAFPHPHIVLVTLLVVISQLLYAFVVLRLPVMLKGAFYPSYAAFTFPLVICAVALSKACAYYENFGMQLSWLHLLALAELVLASVIVAYVFVKYMYFILQANLKKQPPHTDANDALID